MMMTSNKSNHKLYREENMKSTKATPVKQLILTALLAGFGMVFTPVVLAQPMSNHQGQNYQDSQNHQGHGDHGDHGGHGDHDGHGGH
jgi:ABC-type nickel/cobalt efflux system permease component RcnA